MNDRRLPPGDDPVQPTGSGEGPEWSASPVEPPFALPEEDLLGAPTGTGMPDTYYDDVEEDADSDDGQGVYGGEVYRPMGTRRRPTSTVYQPVAAGRGYGCADLITAIFMLMTIAVCGFTLLLLAYPQSPLNPLAPPTFPALMIIATDPPSLTPSMTLTPAPATATPLSTAT